VTLPTVVQLGFAVSAVVAAGALAGAGFRLVGRGVLALATTLVSVLAVAAWVVFAFRVERDIAVSAGGLTVAAVAAAASLALARANRRSARFDAELDRAQTKLTELVAAETAASTAELERLLTRARAESVSLLAEQERRIAEERRATFLERERAAGEELTTTLTQIQQQIEQRLQDWGRDLERSADAMRTRLVELGERQRQLTVDAEARIAADADRLKTESDEQRDAVVRLRGELQHALEETIAAARAEIEQHAGDRRRALHEIGERLRRRERELVEAIEREEAESLRRIQLNLADVERRQVEQLERAVARAGAGFSDEAVAQFANLIKTAREDAARRLNRELDRAVGAFAREAEGVLAEQLAHVGDAGAQRLERRMSQITTALERQRDEFVAAFESRVGDAENDLRRRLADLAADAEAERAVLEARLQELARRFDEAASVRSGAS
jgi:hypothetical protein